MRTEHETLRHFLAALTNHAFINTVDQETERSLFFLPQVSRDWIESFDMGHLVGVKLSLSLSLLRRMQTEAIQTLYIMLELKLKFVYYCRSLSSGSVIAHRCNSRQLLS
jgi:hypothetical protein